MRLIPIALLAVAGCSTVADVRQRPPVWQASSQRSLDELAGCMAQRWESLRGAEVSHVPHKAGFTMTLAFRGGYGRVVALVVDVDDLGAERRIVARGGKKDGQTMQHDMGPCL